MEMWIDEPRFEPYVGAKSALYRWTVDVEARTRQCQNLLFLTATASDQAMDGTSPPTVGPPANGWGWGWVRVVAEVAVSYAHTSLGYHELTVRFVATDTESRGVCAGSRTWLYWPTPVGPAPLIAGTRSDIDESATTITCYVT